MSDTPKLTRRPALDRAAATLAKHLGLTLVSAQAQDLREDGKITGYFWLRWFLVDGAGSPSGFIELKCEGGYGAGGPGPGYFKGTLYVVPQATPQLGKDISEVLVHQFDFPASGRQSAKVTKERFVTWVERFTAHPPAQVGAQSALTASPLNPDNTAGGDVSHSKD